MLEVLLGLPPSLSSAPQRQGAHQQPLVRVLMFLYFFLALHKPTGKSSVRTLGNVILLLMSLQLNVK